jgi:hypothetical protein
VAACAAQRARAQDAHAHSGAALAALPCAAAAACRRRDGRITVQGSASQTCTACTGADQCNAEDALYLFTGGATIANNVLLVSNQTVVDYTASCAAGQCFQL